MNKILLVIDGNALIHRAYHALPGFKTHNGVLTNAVYGFASMLLKTIDDFSPTHVCVCFDTPAKTFRKELYAEYQSHRPEMEDDLSKQFPYVKEFLESAGIIHIEKAGFEADDVIGTISKRAHEEGFTTYILTGDKDIVQLVDDKTFVIAPKKGLTEIQLYTPESALERFGIPADKIPELKGLMGDPSDNYKGVAGIGPKTAATLLTQFKTVANIYDHLDEVASPKTRELLEKGKESAFMSQKLATIVRDLELDISIDKCVRTPYNQSLRDFFEKLEFNTLLKRYFDSKQPAARIEKVEKVEEKEKTDQLDLF